MKTENIIVDHYPAMLETMQETGNSDLMFDPTFHEFMDEALARHASTHVRNQMEYDEFESTVGSIVKLQPAGVTMPTAAQALAEAQERIAPDYELDEDNYRDIDLDSDDGASAIDREIDRLMAGLLAR